MTDGRFRIAPTVDFTRGATHLPNDTAIQKGTSGGQARTMIVALWIWSVVGGIPLMVQHAPKAEPDPQRSCCLAARPYAQRIMTMMMPRERSS